MKYDDRSNEYPINLYKSYYVKLRYSLSLISGLLSLSWSWAYQDFLGLIMCYGCIILYIYSMLSMRNTVRKDTSPYDYMTIFYWKRKGLKCNIENSFFRKTEIEYLGFWVTRNGVKPINRKVETITNINTPTSRKLVRKFIDIIDYY